MKRTIQLEVIMADNNFTQQDYDPSQHMGFQTFKEKEDALKRRELPVLGKVENKIVKYLSYFLAFCSVGSMITLIIFILIGIKKDTNNFTGNGGYGFLGFIAMILFFLSLTYFIVAEMLYHTKWIEKKDHTKEHNLVISGFYLTLFTLSLGYATIWMRPNVMYRANVFSGLGILLLAFAFVLCCIGVFLNYKQSEKNPILIRYFNLVVLLLAFWVPVCNYTVLASDVCNIQVAIYPVIAGAFSAFLGFIFLCGQKKNTGFRTIGMFFTFAAFFLQATSVFYYAMLQMPQIIAR